MASVPWSLACLDVRQKFTEADGVIVVMQVTRQTPNSLETAEAATVMHEQHEASAAHRAV